MLHAQRRLAAAPAAASFTVTELEDDEVMRQPPPASVAAGSSPQVKSGAYSAEAHLKLKRMLEEFERGMAAQQAQLQLVLPTSPQQQPPPSSSRALNRSLLPAMVESAAQ
jgi:hypothetical protein